MRKFDKFNIFVIFEQTCHFQTTFINNYLFIYTLRADIHAQKPPNVSCLIKGGPLMDYQNLILNPYLGACECVYRGHEKNHIALEGHLGSKLQGAPNKKNLEVQVGGFSGLHRISTTNPASFPMGFFWGLLRF